jgi:hypothetical protein
MGWRGTATLMLLLAVVGAYLWFEEAPRKEALRPGTLLGEPRVAEPVAAARHLFDFDPGDVVAVRLQHQGEARQAERSGETWEGASDSGSISDFLPSLAALGVLMDIPAGPGDLKDYGLEPPRSVLELRLRNRTAPLVLLIGDRNPATTGVYARLGENGPVVLAGALVAWEFEKAFKALAPARAPS